MKIRYLVQLFTHFLGAMGTSRSSVEELDSKSGLELRINEDSPHNSLAGSGIESRSSC